MIILATILASLSLLMSALFLVRPKAQLLFLLFLPLAAEALSPIWAIMGLVGAILMILYVWGCTRDHKGFDNAFDPGWKDQIPPQQANKMLKRRWSFYLKMKASPEPIWERDIPFWTIPDKDRRLLCDIWRPADGQATGLAYIYLH